MFLGIRDRRRRRLRHACENTEIECLVRRGSSSERPKVLKPIFRQEPLAGILAWLALATVAMLALANIRHQTILAQAAQGGIGKNLARNAGVIAGGKVGPQRLCISQAVTSAEWERCLRFGLQKDNFKTATSNRRLSPYRTRMKPFQDLI
uniref:Uncharacterized protein n=1 Tax=Lotharella globosa TaxID=91324 RepID=A0A7S3ZA15_9EUKA